MNDQETKNGHLANVTAGPLSLKPAGSYEIDSIFSKDIGYIKPSCLITPTRS